MRVFSFFIITVMTITCLQNSGQSQTWDYGEPFDTTAPPTFFTRVQNEIPRSFMLDSLSYPFPTNVWFKNLFMGKQAAGTTIIPDSTVGSSPFFSYPYTIGFGTIPRPGWLQYTHANRRLGFGYRPYTITISAPDPPIVPGTFSVTYSAAFDFYFGSHTSEGNLDQDSLKPFISNYDDLSVTVKWIKWTSDSGFTTAFMEAPIAKGMPYVTMKYRNMTPYLASQARSLAAISVDGAAFVNLPNPTPLEVEGRRFLLKLNGDGGPGNSIYWILYASDSIRIKAYFDYQNTYSSAPYQALLVCDSTFTGTLRAAYVCAIDNPGPPFPAFNDSVNVEQKLNLLDRYATFYPVSGQFSASIDDTSNVAVLRFIWETNLPSNDSLLMFALPHHLDILINSTQKDTVLDQYQVIKGPLTGIFGKVWVMQEQLIDYSWHAPGHNLSSNVLPKYQEILHKTLLGDHDTISGAIAFPVGVINQINTSTYFGGKNLAKKGRLAVIADELGQWFNTDSIAQDIRDTLAAELNHWLNGSSPLIPANSGWLPNPLLYETRYGGMINTIDYNHVGADFGNSIYTDHHFHYGYFLYAAAAIGKGDSGWLQTNQAKIRLLARDVANPGATDPYFVKNRFIDWYDGHSWAQGLVDAGGLGNNQESTSEATNAWYGLYLLGEVLRDKNMKNTGRLHLACEMRSAQKYWQVSTPDSPYPDSYTDFYKVVGNMYESSINSLVAFGGPGDPRMVYGIQQIPTTPINQTLLQETWCDTIWDFYYKDSEMYSTPDTHSVPHIDQQWMTVNMASIGIVKPGHAYAYYYQYLRNYVYYSTGSTRKADNYDGGESKTNVLYNSFVNAPLLTRNPMLELDIDITIINHDTLGNCSGKVMVVVNNSSQADPPFHFFWLPDPVSDEVYTANPIKNNLCAGTYYVTVIDGEFNIGMAEVTIENTSSVLDHTDVKVLHIYPNPSFSGIFQVDWSEASWQPSEVQIYTASGVLVDDIILTNRFISSIELNLESYKPGVYLLFLQDAQGRSMYAKLVKF